VTNLRPIACLHEGTTLAGLIATPATPGPHPAVLVIHTAFGLGDHMRGVVDRLVRQGYVAVASDMYGAGAYSEDHGEIAEMIKPLRTDPNLLRRRVAAWYDLMKAHEVIDANRIAAVGYCFGGECVLELARSGADVKAVVSFHGLLTTAKPAVPGAVKAQVAVYTGAKDPHAPRKHVEALRDELTTAGARWQITEFGEVYHAFTDPEADTPDLGRAYDAVADAISWTGALALIGAAVGA